MITRKYKFCIATNRIGSTITDGIELQFADDMTEEEIKEEVNNIYSNWLCEQNQGGWQEIT